MAMRLRLASICAEGRGRRRLRGPPVLAHGPPRVLARLSVADPLRRAVDRSPLSMTSDFALVIKLSTSDTMDHTPVFRPLPDS